MFRKINYRLKKFATPEEFRGDLVADFDFIKFYKVKKSYNLIPFELLKLNPDYVHWTDLNYLANLPHTDPGLKTNLNMYIRTEGNPVTKFYIVKNSELSYIDKNEKISVNLYPEESLEYYGEFQAKPYDTYLLDVSCVHQVVGLESGTRSMIQLSWINKTFEQVLKEINAI